MLEMTIQSSTCTVRSYNCLKRAGINTVKELTDQTVSDIDEGSELRTKVVRRN